jgi:hypothetical protein
MESSKRLLEIEYQIKVITDFISRGNYGSVLGIQPHSSVLDGWSDSCKELSAQLEQVSKLINSEVAIARSQPPIDI